MTDTDRIAYALGSIKIAIDELRKLLPDEQLQPGSQLQRIDALVNDLAHKYIVPPDR